MSEERLSLREHIAELRQRVRVVFVTLIALVLFFLLFPINPSELLNLSAVYYTTPAVLFLNRIRADILPSGWTLIGFKVNEPLEVLLISALVFGLAFDMPIIAYETYKFIDPALKEEERKLLYPVVISASLLFLSGLLFGYFILARFIFIALAPFFSAVGAAPVIDAADFYNIVFLSIFFSGVAFTLPIFVYIFIRLGIVDASVFSRNRVLIWVGTYIITAIVTPDGGPLLDIILFFPVIALIEISVYLGKKHVNIARQPSNMCKYCSSKLGEAQLFCPNCGRARN